MPGRHADDTAAEPIRVVPARMWAGLLALTLLATAGALWAVFGTLPQRLTADGVVVRGAEPTVVASTVAGSVTAIAVRAGDHVEAGEALGTVQDTTGAGTAGTVTAPVAGTVARLLAVPGQPVVPGTPVAVLDPDGSPATVLLFVAAGATADLGRVAAGQRVDVLVGGAVVAGLVSGLDPYPPTDTDLLVWFGTTDVAGADTAAATVQVALTDDLPAPTFTPVTGSVLTGDRAPYELLLGTSR